jgi:hypothetical protein
VFFIFGPGSYQGSPAANTIGLLFWFIISFGFNAHFTDSNTSLMAWFLLSFITILGAALPLPSFLSSTLICSVLRLLWCLVGLLGMLPALGFASSITNLNGLTW